MNGRGLLRAALAGADCVAFVPRTWSRLPAFVRVAAAEDFWLDPALTQRMLADAATVCAADGLVVPLLPTRPAAGGPRRDGTPQDLVTDPDVEATVALLERLRSVGSHGLVIELPTLSELGRFWPDVVVEDVEDAFSDLVRAGMEAGGDAASVRGAQADVEETLTLLAPLAAYYGAAAIGVAPDGVWLMPGGPEIGVLDRAGRWPDVSRGAVLTGGDVTDWWSPGDFRKVLAERGHGGG